MGSSRPPSQASAPRSSVASDLCPGLVITATSAGRSVVLSAMHPVVLRTKAGSVITMGSSQSICGNPIEFFGTSLPLEDRAVFADLGPRTFVVRRPATVLIFATNEPSEQYAGEKLTMLREQVTVVAGS